MHPAPLMLHETDLLELEVPSACFGNRVRSKRRNATPMPSLSGWGQGSDGHNVAISHPEGRGLKSAMNNALKDAQARPLPTLIM